jgi:hypothetical protein
MIRPPSQNSKIMAAITQRIPIENLLNACGVLKDCAASSNT